MTAEAREIVRRLNYRLAVEFGDATAEMAREYNGGSSLAEAMRTRIWQKGCQRAWRQMQVLFDTGNIIRDRELEEL